MQGGRETFDDSTLYNFHGTVISSLFRINPLIPRCFAIRFPEVGGVLLETCAKIITVIHGKPIIAEELTCVERLLTVFLSNIVTHLSPRPQFTTQCQFFDVLKYYFSSQAIYLYGTIGAHNSRTSQILPYLKNISGGSTRIPFPNSVLAINYGVGAEAVTNIICKGHDYWAQMSETELNEGTVTRPNEKRCLYYEFTNVKSMFIS